MNDPLIFRNRGSWLYDICFENKADGEAARPKMLVALGVLPDGSWNPETRLMLTTEILREDDKGSVSITMFADLMSNPYEGK